MWWTALACAPSIPEERRAEITARLDEVVAQRDRALAARRTALATADTVVPGDRRCPIEVPVPSMASGSTSSGEEAMRRLQGAQLLTERLEQVSSVADVARSVPPRIEKLDRDIASIRKGLADPSQVYGDDPAAQLQERAGRLLPLGWDVLLIGHTLSAPYLSGVDTFEPGSMAARVVVYSYDDERIACLADVVASSSGKVSVMRTEIGGTPISSTPLTDMSTLHLDLVSNVIGAAAPELRVPAP